MRKILILLGRYYPGFKDGGPVRTMINVTESLKDEYEFFIMCNDRDRDDTEPYKGIKVNDWNKVLNSSVFYVSPNGFTAEVIEKAAEGKDVIYVCGCYDDYALNTFKLKKKGKIKCPVVVASMGNFADSAFKRKGLKKRLFIFVMKALGYFKGITWSVTSEYEMKDVKKRLGKNTPCVIAEDLPRKVKEELTPKSKEKGKAKGLFLSRICAHKNLDFALNALKEVKAEIEYDIYGPIQEQEYLDYCLDLAKKLPPNIKCEYKGVADSENIDKVFEKYDFFTFPSKSENYGHVVFEAMSSGCIPIISDRTPWGKMGLQEDGVGYILPIDETHGFTKAIEEIASLNGEESERIRKKAHNKAIEIGEKSLKETGYRKIFG